MNAVEISSDLVSAINYAEKMLNSSHGEDFLKLVREYKQERKSDYSVLTNLTPVTAGKK